MTDGLLGYIVGAAVVALAVVACGGGSEDAQEEQPVERATVTNPAPTTTGPSAEEAKALVQSMLLRLSDFPSGWRAVPPDDDDEGCAGLDKVSERFDFIA